MKKLIYVLFVLVFVLSAASAFAATADNSNKVADLDARYAHFVCGVTLQQAQASSLGQYVQAPSTDKLTSDLAQIKQAADAGDATAFASATKALQDEVKSTNAAMKDARQSLKALNLSNSTRRQDITSLAASWKSNIATFKTCTLAAQKNVAAVRASQLKADIDRWNKVIADMNSKGFDTTQLQAIVTDANKIESAFTAAGQAADEATFKQQMDDATDSYLHVWARFAITRIDLYVAKITPRANAAGMSDKVSEITGLLDKASAMAAPGHKYAEGEFQSTWQDIKDAGTDLTDLGKSLKAAKAASTTSSTLATTGGSQ